MKHPYFLTLLFATILGFMKPFGITDPADGPGTPQTEFPVPETPAPAAESNTDTRSAARKFLDKLKSSDTHAAENATLRARVTELETQLASATSEQSTTLATLQAENAALHGSAEAAAELLNRISTAEKALGFTPGTLSNGSATDINTAITAKVSAALVDTAATAGVPAERLPQPAAAGTDPSSASDPDVSVQQRIQTELAKFPIFQRN